MHQSTFVNHHRPGLHPSAAGAAADSSMGQLGVGVDSHGIGSGEAQATSAAAAVHGVGVAGGH